MEIESILHDFRSKKRAWHSPKYELMKYGVLTSWHLFNPSRGIANHNFTN